tara:strand:- start:234 stop:374 length:141 start_codon:yes stop_codon:yes gene_type:complete
MKYDEEYVRQKKAELGTELIYKCGIGCGVFLLGIASIIISINLIFS